MSDTDVKAAIAAMDAALAAYRQSLIGRTVVVRSSEAGVYWGRLAALTDSAWVLEDARQAHYWTGAAATPGLAARGPGHGAGERIGPVVASIEGRSLTALMPSTADADERWATAPEWRP